MQALLLSLLLACLSAKPTAGPGSPPYPAAAASEPSAAESFLIGHELEANGDLSAAAAAYWRAMSQGHPDLQEVYAAFLRTFALMGALEYGYMAVGSAFVRQGSPDLAANALRSAELALKQRASSRQAGAAGEDGAEAAARRHIAQLRVAVRLAQRALAGGVPAGQKSAALLAEAVSNLAHIDVAVRALLHQPRASSASPIRPSFNPRVRRRVDAALLRACE